MKVRGLPRMGHDGIPDGEEDQDDDGSSNYWEHDGNSDPTDPQSLPELKVMMFIAEVDRRYEASDYSDPDWAYRSYHLLGTTVGVLTYGRSMPHEELVHWLGLSEPSWPAYPPVLGEIDLTLGKQKLSRQQDFPEQPPAGWGACDFPPLGAVRGSFHFHSREVTVPNGGNGEEVNYLRYWGANATRKVWVLLNRRLTEDLEVPFLKIGTKASTLDYQNEGTWLEVKIDEATKVTLGDPEVVKLTVRAGENVSETGVVLDPLEANEGTFENEMRYDVDLLPVELDIVHPATGELDEGKQSDPTEGGYVAVRRDDETPVTKLVIREGASVEGMKYRIKFDAGANFKIWKDEARTQSVTSEQTEFEPDQETTLYLEGLKKSDSIGQHEITLQAVIGGESHDAETIYSTVVEAEFDVWLNVFIPVQWTDFPAAHPIHNDFLMINPVTGVPIYEYRRKIAAGDDRSFNDEFFDDPARDVDDIPGGTSSRVHAQVTIIPFKDLDDDGIKNNSYKDAIGISHNYLKDGSVPDPGAGYSATNRLLPQPIITQVDRESPDKLKNPSDSIERYGIDQNAVRFRFEGSADNPIVNPSPAIDWDFQIAITVNNANVLAPKWLLLGDWQDGFPGYEIYIRDSDGDQGDNKGTPIYQYDPIPLGRTPVDLFPDSVPGSIDETVTPANGEVP